MDGNARHGLDHPGPPSEACPGGQPYGLVSYARRDGAAIGATLVVGTAGAAEPQASVAEDAAEG